MAKDGEVSFLIRNVPGGLMSGFLSGTARAGDSLAMDGPLGSFYLREIHRPLLMLAGGTGLAPFTAMLERIAEQGSAHPLHLVYGVTHDVDLVGLERLEAFAERIPGFTWSACVASADSDYPRKGYVTEHIAAQHLHEGDVDIYLCGPPPMVEAVERYLREQGVRPANFYYESSPPARPEPERAKEIPMNDRFRDKVALVSGAAQGIGLGVVRRLLEEGARVVAVDRSELVHELAGDACLCLTADLERYAECQRVLERTLERFGRLDILVNNVGGTLWAKPYQHYAEDEIEAELRRSLLPTLWCCRAALPAMLGQGSGAIVNVSSVATRGVNRVPYGAAKGGVNALTACLAFRDRRPGHPRQRGGAGRHRRAAAKDSAQRRGAERGGAALVSTDRRADPRQQPDEALRQHRRAGRGDPLPRLRRGVLHYRRDPAGSWRRPRLSASVAAFGELLQVQPQMLQECSRSHWRTASTIGGGPHR